MIKIWRYEWTTKLRNCCAMAESLAYQSVWHGSIYGMLSWQSFLSTLVVEVLNSIVCKRTLATKPFTLSESQWIVAVLHTCSWLGFVSDSTSSEKSIRRQFLSSVHQLFGPRVLQLFNWHWTKLLKVFAALRIPAGVQRMPCRGVQMHWFSKQRHIWFVRYFEDVQVLWGRLILQQGRVTRPVLWCKLHLCHHHRRRRDGFLCRQEGRDNRRIFLAKSMQLYLYLDLEAFLVIHKLRPGHQHPMLWWNFRRVLVRAIAIDHWRVCRSSLPIWMIWRLQNCESSLLRIRQTGWEQRTN